MMSTEVQPTAIYRVLHRALTEITSDCWARTLLTIHCGMVRGGEGRGGDDCYCFLVKGTLAKVNLNSADSK